MQISNDVSNMSQIIQQWPIDKLIEYENNPRINDHAVDKIADAIKYYGFRIPIVIKSNGSVIDGHLRLKAARKLGLKEIPVVLADDLTDIQIKAFRLSVNKMAELADWDEDLLRIELDFLKDEDFDLSLTGFDLDDLNFYLEPEKLALTDEDNVPEQPSDPVSKLGDVWLLGKHRVMVGDSTKIEDVEKLMDGKKADMVFTDPPYGVSYADKNAFLNAVGKGNCNQTAIENDHQSIPEMKELWLQAFTILALFTTNKASYYITGPQGGELMMMMMMMIDKSCWQLKHMLIWAKNNHVLGRCDYHYKHEPILFGWKKNGTHEFYGTSSNFSLWEINKPTKSDLHPTMKPVELVERAILNSSKKQNIIIDLFLGSGSTIIAAEKTNRICYGMEISENYCDVIVKRWQDYTGKTAILESTGEKFP